MRIAFLTTDHRDGIPGCTDPQPRIGYAPGALLQGFDGLAGAEVHIISCLKEPMHSVKTIAPNIFYHAAVVPSWGWLKGAYLGCIQSVRRIIANIEPDIVHGQGTERFAAIAAAFSGKPAVITIHGNMRAVARKMGANPLSFHWLTARLEEFTVPRVEGVVCLSRYAQDQVAGLARKTWVIQNAVSKQFFDVAPAKASCPTLLCVARVCSYKNQVNLIRALDPLADRIPFRLTFAGDADLTTDYGREFAKLVAQRPWCEHIGYVEGESLRKLYAESTLLVLPSLEDNCPMAALESAAAGVPIAASNIGGIPDLISEGENGVLFDPSKPEEMRNKIAALLINPVQLASMAARAKSRALARNLPTVVATEHLKIYEEVLKSR